ncbi:MAG TPA: SDR family NAD(P)-dependent oxidoreductase [Candidatus Saccharimonadales bacterium]|nr:SDR family NAD(P)-dependent oxidoreductase [Candidatus Saccharimonadales bacterium]
MNITKIVVITGASRGLGLVTANAFASEGWKVVGTGTSPRPSELPEAVEYHQFDASNAVDCQAFWAIVKASAPKASITLINNAGGYISGKFQELEPEVYQKQMNANFFAAVYMTHALTKIVESARIINIISTAAHVSASHSAAYGASKAAEKYFFQTLQKELKSSAFKITNIYPDAIATHGGDSRAMSPEDLAYFVRSAAEFKGTYYIRDITLATSM